MWSLIHQLSVPLQLGKLPCFKYMSKNLWNAVSLGVYICMCAQDMHVRMNSHMFELHG